MHKAFTLIELLVVVLIIGILAAIALPQYQTAVEKARFSEAFSMGASLRRAIDVWRLENPESTGIFTDKNANASLDIDLSHLDCSQAVGCKSKDFTYGAGCSFDESQYCSVTVTRELSEDTYIDLEYGMDQNGKWYGDSCMWSGSVYEKLCKSWKAQGLFEYEDYLYPSD